MSLSVPRVSWSEIPAGAGASSEPGTAQGTIPIPRGLLGTRRAFASWEQGELEHGESRMCQARARPRELGCWHWEQEGLEDAEELGKAPQRNQLWNGLDRLEILGKMAGKRNCQQNQLWWEQQIHLEGTGQEMGQGQREFRWRVIPGFWISHWMSLSREKGC